MRRPLSALLLTAILGTVSCSGPSATAPSAAPASATFTLTGTLVAFGQPVGGQVTIVSGSSTGKTAAALSNGGFLFSKLPAGPISLQATSDGYAPQVLNLTITTNQTVQITLKPLPFKLTGLVTDADTSAPVPNATVSLNGRYPAKADATGRYVIDGLLDNGALGTRDNIVWAATDGYDPDVIYVMSATENLHLHRARTIMLGAPVQVTVTPDDSLCENDAQEATYGFDIFLCRTLHVTAPSDGVLTVEAVSTAGIHYALYVDAFGHPTDWLANPTSVTVKAGADTFIAVEQPIALTTPTTFTVTTAFTPNNP